MNIDKAIELHTLDKSCDFEGDSQDLKAAHDLGVEAMKAIRDIRQKHLTYTIDLLPGETED